MVKRDDSTGDYLGIACDGCGVMAPPAADILAGHGLVNMGWHCAGGTHICPKHEHPVIPAPVRFPMKAGGRGAG